MAEKKQGEELIILDGDPFAIFGEWLAEAEASEPNDPTAMALSTVDEKGRPSSRMVLLKAWDERGFVFYTNFESRKGQQLLSQPYAALLFHWKSLRRQIRIEGRMEVVTQQEADAYFASRPKGAQIGAWASKQSSPMESRLAFEKRIAQFTAKYAVGSVPRPENWSGFRIIADRMEFWRDRRFRLHDRADYQLDEQGQWIGRRLYP